MVKDQVPIDVGIPVRSINHRCPRKENVLDVGGLYRVGGSRILNVDVNLHGGSWQYHGRHQGEDKAGNSFVDHVRIIS